MGGGGERRADEERACELCSGCIKAGGFVDLDKRSKM